MQGMIPLYSADGELHDWISEQRMARMDRLGLIRVVQHKKGRVSRCILHQRSDDPRPTKLSDYLGTRYSYRERLDTGHMVWTLRKLRQTGAHSWPTLARKDNGVSVRQSCQENATRRDTGAIPPRIRDWPGFSGPSSASAAADEMTAQFRYRLAQE